MNKRLKRDRDAVCWATIVGTLCLVGGLVVSVWFPDARGVHYRSVTYSNAPVWGALLIFAGACYSIALCAYASYRRGRRQPHSQNRREADSP